jgi:hypothetical protein
MVLEESEELINGRRFEHLWVRGGHGKKIAATEMSLALLELQVDRVRKGRR